METFSFPLFAKPSILFLSVFVVIVYAAYSAPKIFLSQYLLRRSVYRWHYSVVWKLDFTKMMLVAV